MSNEELIARIKELQTYAVNVNGSEFGGLIHRGDVLKLFASDRAVQPEETAWLVELGCSPPKWWTGRGDEWTPYVDGTLTVRGHQADSAMRFSRREDAERAIGWLVKEGVRDGCKATQHLWMAASDRAVKEPDWQPIATAPKDGSRFLGGWTHRAYGWLWAGCRWYDDKGAKPVEGGYFVAEGGGEPTHWLRLPALAAEGLIASPASQKDEKDDHTRPR